MSVNFADHPTFVAADVDVRHLRGLDTLAEPSLLGGGFNSTAIHVGNVALKVSKTVGTEDKASALIDVYRAERDTTATFVGDNIPRTSYELVPSIRRPDAFRVATVQDFIGGGTTIEGYFQNPENSFGELIAFLRDCLAMHDQKRQIPDLANIEGLFSIFRNSNVVMANEKPWLVDVNFGKTQRSRILGPLWTELIAVGVKRGLQKIKNR